MRYALAGGPLQDGEVKIANGTAVLPDGRVLTIEGSIQRGGAGIYKTDAGTLIVNGMTKPVTTPCVPCGIG